MFYCEHRSTYNMVSHCDIPHAFFPEESSGHAKNMLVESFTETIHTVPQHRIKNFNLFNSNFHVLEFATSQNDMIVAIGSH